MNNSRKTLHIKSFSRENEGILACAIEIDGKPENISMRFSDNVSQYLTIDRCDAIVMGVLMFAIRHNLDIVSELPISSTLYYKLSRHFLPGICTDKVFTPRIKAEVTSDISDGGDITATGISCGVDSLYTIMEHTGAEVPADFRLNHLVFLNAGAHHFGTKEQSMTLYQGRYESAVRFSESVKLPLIEISTNLPEVLEKYSAYDHVENHTFMMLSCILMIQRGVRRYYYSGGYPYSWFDCNLLNDRVLDCAHYDLFTLWCASGSKTEFYSTGGSLSRYDKVKALSNYVPAEAALNVCVASVHNCGECFKCKRTMLELDAAGIIDKYNKVFDVERYKKNRRKLILEGYRGALKGDDLLKELSVFFHTEISRKGRMVQKMRVVAGKFVTMFR